MMTLTQDDLNAIEGLFSGKFDGIDKRFESIDKRFESMDKQLVSLDNKVEGINLRLEHVESDVAALKSGQLNFNKMLKKVSDKVDATYELALDNWGQIEESKGRIAILEG